MSKRLSTGQNNKIFNYFQSLGNKSSPQSPKVKTETEVTPSRNGDSTPIRGKSKRESRADSESPQVKRSEQKRRRINVIDSDSDDEVVNVKKTKTEIECDTVKTPSSKRKEETSDESDEEKSKTKIKKFAFVKTKKEKDDDDDDTEKQSSSGDVKGDLKPIIPTDMHTNWFHNKLEFLQPDKIRDKAGRRPEHPDYDYRTVYIPQSFLDKQTPAMRQWWILKSDHMDCVIFFKVGKFYELYHMDAVVGVTQMGFSYMKGDFAHSGFPETAYHKMVTILISKGFKVARTEQTETPEMMAERCKLKGKTNKFDKVVNREICQISTKASCVLTAQLPEANSTHPIYMFSITEKDITNKDIRFGVTFVDTSIGTFYMAEFDDDKHFSRLLSLMSEYNPGLLLLERRRLSPKLKQVVSTYFKTIRKEYLLAEQFYSASKTIEKLHKGQYFLDKNNKLVLPKLLNEITDNYDPKPDCELMLKALGACLWFLEDSKLDIQVVSMGKFERYNPFNTNLKEFMILDSVCMRNLNLLGEQDSLQKTIDYCQTAFGKRLLLQWICRPLCDVEKINERQQAIKELYETPSKLKDLQEILKKLPDLERQVTKIHHYGNKQYASNHPDSRAIFYESKTYSKRQINDLLTTLHAFERNSEIVSLFKGCNSTLLKRITHYAPEGINVNLTKTLEYFKEAFDQKQAQEQGKIIPTRGVHKEFDDIEQKIDDINKELNDYLKEQQKFFGCKVTYFGSDKKRFQLDVPESHAKKVTNDYQLEGAKKGGKPSKRYSTAETRGFLAEMLKAEAERAKIILDLNRQIFEKFSEKYELWEVVIQCLATLDVLSSLAEYARNFSQDICIPVILPFSKEPEIIIENGRHPCITNIDNFVPNDTKMGIEGYANILLLTGPNMGGKSTLMRQIAIISILAQIGSYVPASRCELSLIDRIFTRLGGQDDIIQGRSTFLVELAEASVILQHATKHSLVVLDELGRGTSTHDGNAIATAYVKKLVQINCRSLFSTHYHSLVDEFENCKDIQLVHMACVVENDEDPTEESVTFLYKMASGRCPKSYGFNVARLAGLKPEIVARGREIASDLEQKSKYRELFRLLYTKELDNVARILTTVHI